MSGHTKAIIGGSVSGIALGAVLIFAMHEGDKRAAEASRVKYERFIKPAIDRCFEQGGVPITSGWDGRLKECQFKP